jgi:hypothetical protein
VRGPALAEELTGLPAAIASFTDRAATPGRRSRRVVQIALAAAAMTVMLAGTAAAAYRDALPAPLQRIAHAALGAPAPAGGAGGASEAHTTRAAADHPPTDIGPSSTPTSVPTAVLSAGSAGRSAAGLCQAWVNQGGQVRESSAIARSLTALAEGTDRITTYCDGMLAATADSKSDKATGPESDNGNHTGQTKNNGKNNDKATGPGNDNGNHTGQTKNNDKNNDKTTGPRSDNDKTTGPGHDNGNHAGPSTNSGKSNESMTGSATKGAPATSAA